MLAVAAGLEREMAGLGFRCGQDAIARIACAQDGSRACRAMSPVLPDGKDSTRTAMISPAQVNVGDRASGAGPEVRGRRKKRAARPLPPAEPGVRRPVRSPWSPMTTPGADPAGSVAASAASSLPDGCAGVRGARRCGCGRQREGSGPHRAAAGAGTCDAGAPRPRCRVDRPRSPPWPRAGSRSGSRLLPGTSKWNGIEPAAVQLRTCGRPMTRGRLAGIAATAAWQGPDQVTAASMRGHCPAR